MAERVLNFVNAGDQDVSEVTISTGVHSASPTDSANPLRVTYTVSYPDPPDTNAFREEFVRAADAIINDAENRGVTPGQP